MADLTTRYLAKLYAGITGTSQDDLIDRMISDVSAAVEEFCDRSFELTEYRVWLDGTGSHYLTLPNWPITRIYAVGCNVEQFLTIENTTAKLATVRVPQAVDQLELFSQDTSGDATDATVGFATYKTIDTLVAQINTLTGWAATTFSTRGESSSLLLRPTAGEDATSTYQVQLYGFDESSRMRIAADGERQLVSQSGAFKSGPEKVFVWYKAGYTLPVDNGDHSGLTTAGNLPGGLVAAVNQAIKDIVLNSTANTTMESEKIKNYSYKRGSASGNITAGSTSPASSGVAAAIQANKAAFEPYRNLGIGYH